MYVTRPLESHLTPQPLQQSVSSCHASTSVGGLPKDSWIWRRICLSFGSQSPETKSNKLDRKTMKATVPKEHSIEEEGEGITIAIWGNQLITNCFHYLSNRGTAKSKYGINTHII
ncbi:hypothetical protein Dimus_001938 [Dionaea muscipula]